MLILAVLILLLLAKTVFVTEKRPFVEINSSKIIVSLASTPEEKARGLSGRTSLPADEGMLFVYDRPEVQKFWMKDMNFPIDIIWIGTDKTVVDIANNLDPGTYPETFSPDAPAQYVLEVNAGYAQGHGISLGDTAVIRFK